MFSKDMVMTGVGLIGGSALTGFVFTKFGPTQFNTVTQQWELKPTKDTAPAGTAIPFQLPGLGDKLTGAPNHYGRAGYSLLINTGAAFVAQKIGQPSIARGLMLNGLSWFANEIISAITAPPATTASTAITTSNTAGTSQYFPAAASPRPLLRYGMNRGLSGAGYEASRVFGASPMVAQSAFQDTAFHK